MEYSIMLDYQIIARGPNPFGQLIGGWIMLRGGVKQTCIRGSRTSPVILESDNGEPGEEVGGAWLDMNGAPGFNPLDIWCLRVRGTMGLILTHENQNGSSYRRIGVFSLGNKGEVWFSSCDELTVKVV
jgi:hypothetical protein